MPSARTAPSCLCKLEGLGQRCSPCAYNGQQEVYASAAPSLGMHRLQLRRQGAAVAAMCHTCVLQLAPAYCMHTAVCTAVCRVQLASA